MIARFRLPSVAPSSPRSRPRPAGGLRPALTPAAGGTPRTAAGTRHEERAQNKIHQLEVSTLSGDGRLTLWPHVRPQPRPHRLASMPLRRPQVYSTRLCVSLTL